MPATNLAGGGLAPSLDGEIFPLYNHWRAAISQAVDSFGGIAWQPNRLYAIHADMLSALSRYVGCDEPSPFKRTAAFAVAFMDDSNFPIYGEFDSHIFKEDLKRVPHWSGGILVYEFIRYVLHGAKIQKNGLVVTLDNPIKVSKHSYIDIIHALTNLKKTCPADFHLMALLIEQLVYQENDASYPRNY